MSKNKKPELLLPAGNIEAFHAALEGGADAIYTGFRKFNARARANNFSESQLSALISTAHAKGKKVFVTLNTVIKNEEIPELLDTLFQLKQLSPNAIIVQDWGTYYLAKNYFPELTIHASTQMANHNSVGANFAQKLGIERTILARELTMKETQQIRKNCTTEIEMFVHGALCYSFSGMCMFSSFLGGRGANRGQCAQPCRRIYQNKQNADYIFSLKDNQLIDYVPELTKLGISCLKVEGRMKSAEYVYQVAQAYRMVIDNPDSLLQAKELLNLDLGREKTSWFMGGDVSQSIGKPTTGLLLGKIDFSDKNGFVLDTKYPLKLGNRIRIQAPDDTARDTLKLKDMKQKGDDYFVSSVDTKARKGDKVYLASLREKNFPSSFSSKGKFVKLSMPQNAKQNIINQLGGQKTSAGKPMVYVRINSVNWMRKVWLDSVDGVFLNFSKKELKAFDLNAPFLQKNKHKYYLELPKFISELELDWYKNKIDLFIKKGFKNFVISHLSQKLLIPGKMNIITNENVYAFNDACIAFMQKQKLHSYVLPLENDIENLYKSRYRDGIMPVYFYPELFYSRMPVKSDTNANLIDDNNGEYRKLVIDGITRVVPVAPVSLLQYVKKLRSKGYNNYLIDLSYEPVSKNAFKRIMGRFSKSEQVQPSHNFNFRHGLK